MFNSNLTKVFISTAAAAAASVILLSSAQTADAATYRNAIYDPSTGKYSYEDAPEYAAPAPNVKNVYYDSMTGTYYYYDQQGYAVRCSQPAYDPYYNIYLPVNNVIYTPVYTAPVQPVKRSDTTEKRTVRTPYGKVTVTSSAKNTFSEDDYTVVTTETIGRTKVSFYGDELGYTTAVWKSGRRYYTATMASTDIYTIESAVTGII